MSERYPDEYWLADFERRLNDGRLLIVNLFRQGLAHIRHD